MIFVKGLTILLCLAAPTAALASAPAQSRPPAHAQPLPLVGLYTSSSVPAIRRPR